MERFARLYGLDNDGSYVDLKWDMDIDGELCGAVPCVGDLIVNPGVSANLDRRDPANREIMEVVVVLPAVEQRGLELRRAGGEGKTRPPRRRGRTGRSSLTRKSRAGFSN